MQTNIKRKVKSGQLSIIEIINQNSRVQANIEIQDPSERLISMLGSTMMNEPKYFPEDANNINKVFNSQDFDEQAKNVIQTAFEVANSESPRDLLAIANWARNKLGMRTTPQVLLAIAANCIKTKEFVRKYCPKIIKRADELKQAFIAYRILFGTDKSLPNSLKRGLSDSFSKFKEIDFLKWEGKDRPTFGDVLKMVDRHKNYPLQDALAKYLITGQIINPKEIPIVYSRTLLAKE